jgi:uncharacterized protein (UPF0333 family)
MALERHDMSDELRTFIARSNLLFTCLFAAEMLLKLCVRGMRAYWCEPFDCFDGIVVLTALLELALVRLVGVEGVGVQELRLLRLMRTLKLVRSWRSLRTVMRSLLVAMASLRYLFLVLVLVLFVFAILGMQLFGGKLLNSRGASAGSEVAQMTQMIMMQSAGRDRGNSLPSRNLFDSFTASMVTSFVVVSLEDWNDYYVVTSASVGNWCYLYYFALLVIGNYLVLNLVVAVVIGGYVDSAEQQAQEEADAAAAARMQARARGMLARQKFFAMDKMHVNDLLEAVSNGGATGER